MIPSIPASTHLPPLPLARLAILKREPTRPLIRARLPANPTIAARKQNAPERHGSQKRAAQRTQAEAKHARLGPQSVAVECAHGVQDGGDGERGQRVGGFGVEGGCCGAWGGGLVCGML